MKKFAAVAALAAYTGPAHATATGSCLGPRAPGVSLSLTIGHLAGAVIAEANLTRRGGTVEGRREGGQRADRAIVDR